MPFAWTVRCATDRPARRRPRGPTALLKPRAPRDRDQIVAIASRECQIAVFYPVMQAVQIRRATPHDADEIVALWKRAGATESVTDRPVDVRRAIARDNVAFVIASADGGDDGGGRVIGSIIGTFDGWRGNMYRLAVDPAHRRRGVARALVAEVERAFSGWGVRRVTALVERDHPWAVAFWRAAGYLLDERMDRYVRML